MLYDPKWAQAKADPFSLDSLLAWLEKQPADDRFDYLDSRRCLLCQYFTAAGFKNVYVFEDCFYHGDEPIPGLMGRDECIAAGLATRLPPLLRSVAISSRPWTFGAALKLARELRGRCR